MNREDVLANKRGSELDKRFEVITWLHLDTFLFCESFEKHQEGILIKTFRGQKFAFGCVQKNCQRNKLEVKTKYEDIFEKGAGQEIGSIKCKSGFN